MIAPVKKLIAPEGRSELAGRFGAWWRGYDYTPPAAEKTVVDTGHKRRDMEPIAPSPRNDAPGKIDMRLRALTMAWGAQRFGPGSDEIDNRVLDAAFEVANSAGPIGFIGADPAMLAACRARSDRTMFAAEWRQGCFDRVKKEMSASKVVMAAADIDRPLFFPERKLEGMVSLDAFAYADHKAGLAARVHKALTGTGRWVCLDIARHTTRTPAAAFASAWAEPQLPTPQEVDDLLATTGFVSVEREDATKMVVSAARDSLRRLGKSIEDAVNAGLNGAEGAGVLQEIAWEIQSWQARVRALEGGALGAYIWTIDKDPMRRKEGASTPKPVKIATEVDADGMPVASAPAPAAELVLDPLAPAKVWPELKVVAPDANAKSGQGDIDALFDN